MQKDSSRKIAVASRTFSKHPFLREELLKRYTQVVFNDDGKRFNSDELTGFLKGSDAAIVALEKITAEVIASLPQLKVISKYGVGLDNLDLPAIQKAGIQLGWKGGVNRRSVSELVLFFILGQIRGAFSQISELKIGQWNPQSGHNLSGKTIGIIGMGNIGQDLVQLLQPFGCKISFHDVVQKPEICNRFSVRQTSLETLLSESEVISVHVPFTEKTKNLIDSKEFSLMKPGTIFINTSRGGIISETALLEALNAKRVKACMDVFTEEPTQNKTLLDHPHFFGTPHIGGTTEESIRLMGLAAIEGLDHYKDPLSYEP